MNLAANRFKGEIPVELATLSRLEYLDLAHNQFTGQIPTELTGLSRLKSLHLAGNLLEGEILPELESMSSLPWTFQVTSLPGGYRLPLYISRQVGVGRFALGQETVAQRGRPDRIIIEPEQLPGPLQARIGKDGPKEKHD